MLRPVTVLLRLFFCILISSLLLSCRKNCTMDEAVRIPYSEAMKKYGDVFKPGNWWVYENPSGDRDSVYVTDFIEGETITFNEQPCEAMPIRTMSLRTTSMDSQGVLNVTYSQSRSNCCFSMLGVDGSFWLCFNQTEGYHTSDLVPMHVIADTIVQSNPYDNCILLGPPEVSAMPLLRMALFASDIGIVQYITATDTFTLSESHVQ